MQESENKKENHQQNEPSKNTCIFKKIIPVIAIIIAFFFMHAAYLASTILASYTIETPAATATSACPTSDILKGSSGYETSPKDSAAKATADASSLLQSRADTEAGLAKNGYTCPNSACQRKTLGAVTANPYVGYPTATRATLFAILSSIFRLDDKWYWSGQMEYAWKATVTCR